MCVFVTIELMKVSLKGPSLGARAQIYMGVRRNLGFVKCLFAICFFATAPRRIPSAQLALKIIVSNMKIGSG